MHLRLVATLALGLLGAQSANAVIIDGKDWRQLTETTDFSWLVANSSCGSGLCTGSIGDVSVDGWYWADDNDVRGLFDALIKPESTQFAGNTTLYASPSDADIANAVRNVFDPTSIFNFGNVQYLEVRGMTRSNNGFNATSVAYLQDAPFANSPDYAAFDTTWPKNLADTKTGLWLYKLAPTSVPEPGVLTLFGAGIAGIAFLRRKRAA